MQLKWDLTPLYPSFESDAFQNDLKNLRVQLTSMKERYTFSDVTDAKTELISYGNDLNAALSQIFRLHAFAGLTFQANTADETAMRGSRL